MKANEVCVFILTYARPDRVKTYETLKSAGYTGAIYLVVGEDDDHLAAYRARYGEQVITFSKEEAATYTDPGDNSGDLRTPLYARNACFKLAESLGYTYFIELDDDYSTFMYRMTSDRMYGYQKIVHTLDAFIDSLLAFYKSAPISALSISQGGDWIGGRSNNPRSTRRKAMNWFLCSTERPFEFTARLNDDVTTYVTESHRGRLFLTVMAAQLVQSETQTNAGGITEAYLDSGTYVKTFFSVMYAPSCVQIGVMEDPRGGNPRIHHVINWHRAAPKILRQSHKRARPGEAMT